MTHLFALFVSAFTSATLLPGSSELLLLALLADGQANIVPLVLVATAGNTLGSLANWVLGRYFAHFRNRKWFPVSAQRYAQAEGWYNKYGIWLLLMSWVPIAGDPLTVVAGTLRVGFWRFLIFVATGKLLRYSFIAGAAFWWFSDGASQPL